MGRPAGPALCALQGCPLTIACHSGFSTETLFAVLFPLAFFKRLFSHSLVDCTLEHGIRLTHIPLCFHSGLVRDHAAAQGRTYSQQPDSLQRTNRYAEGLSLVKRGSLILSKRSRYSRNSHKRVRLFFCQSPPPPPFIQCHLAEEPDEAPLNAEASMLALLRKNVSILRASQPGSMCCELASHHFSCPTTTSL
jgi:hypothetical protein